YVGPPEANIVFIENDKVSATPYIGLPRFPGRDTIYRVPTMKNTDSAANLSYGGNRRFRYIRSQSAQSVEVISMEEPETCHGLSNILPRTAARWWIAPYAARCVRRLSIAPRPWRG